MFVVDKWLAYDVTWKCKIASGSTHQYVLGRARSYSRRSGHRVKIVKFTYVVVGELRRGIYTRKEVKK